MFFNDQFDKRKVNMGDITIKSKDDFTIDSDNLSMYDGYLEIGGLRYYVDLSKETASRGISWRKNIPSSRI